jgi:hypothetical protein
MIERAGDTIMLRGPCPVEDAETLLTMLQDGAAGIDWSGCTLLHTACLQVLLAAGVPVTGTPAEAGLAKWVKEGLLF